MRSSQCKSTFPVERTLLFAVAALALLVFLSSCASGPSKPLDPASLVLGAGSRILVAVAEPDTFSYRLLPLSRNLPLPDGIEAVSLERPSESGDLQTLVAEALERKPAQMVLLFEPRKIVEERYDPYPVFQGWYTESVIEGYVDRRPVYRQREVPRFMTEYRHRCTRTRYRILQYGPNAEPMGRVDPETASPLPCPENSDTDIFIDEFEAAANWLERNMSD